MTSYTIQRRNKVEVNTDPQRRCYNGCHFSSEMRWTEWQTLEILISPDAIDRRLQFWKELNDYAVSERGECAKAEFQIVNEKLK